MKNFKSLNNTVTALADVATFDVNSLERLTLDIGITNAALTAFELWYRCNSDGNFFKFASAAADFTSPAGIMVGCAKDDNTAIDMTTAASGTKASIVLDVRGLSDIKIRAASGTSSGMNIYGGGA